MYMNHAKPHFPHCFSFTFLKKESKQREIDQGIKKMNDPIQGLEIPNNMINIHNDPVNEDQEEPIDPTLLRVDSFNSSTNSHLHTPCSTCGCCSSSFSNKRRSPDTKPSSMDNPKKPKRLFLEPHEITTTTSTPSLHGFSKISLPFQTQTQIPVLLRCISEPCSPPVSNLCPQSPTEAAKIAGVNAVTTPASNGSAPLPPRPPVLRKVVSDPSPSKSISPSSSSNDIGADESPTNMERLKRMRYCMTELNMWWNELLPDGETCEEEADKATEANTANATKGHSVTEFEESVSVEKTGECLVIHFKCPCSKGYEILLTGRNCYYKLM